MLFRVIISFVLALTLFNANAQNGKFLPYYTSSAVIDSNNKIISQSKYYLPIEGSAYIPFIDTTSSMSELINKLNTDWKFIETFKVYWIGFTDVMFSIANKGDLAIEPLKHFADTLKNQHGREGAVYSLYLIGINGKIEGRGNEKFINPKAREALLYLLRNDSLQSIIISLLSRNRWFSDVPALFVTLRNCQLDCWPIVSGIPRYGIADLPICQQLPEEFETIRIHVYDPEPSILRMNFDFDHHFKQILKQIKNLHRKDIIVEKNLFKSKLGGSSIYKFKDKTSLPDFLYDVSSGRFFDIGNGIQYYLKNGVLYICSSSTARKILLDWWQQKTDDYKAQFN